MNDCFLVFIKSFSLEQFSRVFTGIYQCLNLIHYALTVFRISYTKPFAGSIQNFYSCSSVVNQFIHHQRDKEFALQVLVAAAFLVAGTVVCSYFSYSYSYSLLGFFRGWKGKGNIELCIEGKGGIE